MKNHVIVEVVLRASDGSSFQDAEEPIRPEEIKHYTIDEDRKQEAHEKLQAYGFEVIAAGPFSLSVSCEKDTFERIFQTQLQAVSAPGIATEAKTFYEALSPIKIPEDLASFVANVAFPAPPELFP